MDNIVNFGFKPKHQFWLSYLLDYSGFSNSNFYFCSFKISGYFKHTKDMNRIHVYCRAVAKSAWFNNFIMAVILLTAVVVGIQTYGEKVAEYKSLLFTIDQIILFIFLIEVFIRMGGHGNKPLRYFKDPWNVFDFTIVAVCYIALLFPELEGHFVAVFRLARVMRVFRIIRTIPKLQLLVNVLLKSIPSIGYIAILLSVIFYIYATMGVFLFKYNDPVHFGNLQLSLLSLFRIVTLEDWTDILYINMYGCDHPIWGYSYESGCTTPYAMGGLAVAFFVSFVLIGTMIVLNLFIGVIMNSMEEARYDVKRRDHFMRMSKEYRSADDELDILLEKVDALKEDLENAKYRIRKKTQREKPG